jgi:phenylpropionate dioxygenase-like ring-hydroxylating dioxygenase large terminal subunit
MVYIPTRGDAPPRIGGDIVPIPDVGNSTLSADVYRDPMRYELELEHVIRKTWLIAAHGTELPNANDWVTYEGHGDTVIITRQPDGSVRAFHNVCQHRGVRLTFGQHSGCQRRFTCPYHGWVYDTTGKLVGVPEREEFDTDLLKLQAPPPIAAQEWGGFVWINFAGDQATPLLEYLGPDVTNDLGQFKPETMVLHEKQVFEVDINYKAIVDAFNEVYHANHLHHTGPEFARESRLTAFHLSGPHSMMFVPRFQKSDQLVETGDHHKYTICHYVVFPNQVFNNNPDQIQVFNPIPMGPEKTKFVLWELIYGPEPGESDEDYQKYFGPTMERWQHLQNVIAEDHSMFQELAATKHSSGYVRNIFGNQECKITEYHRTMEHCVRGGSPMDRYGQEPTRGVTRGIPEINRGGFGVRNVEDVPQTADEGPANIEEQNFA